jgi:hypothetical protein
MARAILRYSLQSGNAYSHERTRRTRATTAIRSALEAAGFASVGTAAWEGTGDTATILGAVGEVVAIVKDQAPEMLDHVWFYVDATGV